MRKQILAGLILIVSGLVVLLASSFLGLISNLYVASQTIIVAIVTAMIVSGGSLVWNARKPDERENRRKEDIWNSIKKWVELPVARFQDQKDTLPLCEKPPELADAVDALRFRVGTFVWNRLLFDEPEGDQR